MPVVPAEGAGQLEDLDEPPEPRVRGGSGRASLMKPLVVLALPGMYLFYKYSQYRREQRELSRRRVTERELQHLHHKIVSISCISFLFCCLKFVLGYQLNRHVTDIRQRAVIRRYLWKDSTGCNKTMELL